MCETIECGRCCMWIRQMHNWLSRNQARWHLWWMDMIVKCVIKFQLYLGENFETSEIVKDTNWNAEHFIDFLFYLKSYLVLSLIKTQTLNHWNNPVTHCGDSDEHIRQTITTRHCSPTRDTNNRSVHYQWCSRVTWTNRRSGSTENAEFLINYVLTSVRDAVHFMTLFIWNCPEIHSLKQVSSSWEKSITVSSPSSENAFNTSSNKWRRHGNWLN